MRKKEIGWIVLLLVLGGVYIHFFGHWFDKKQMVIRASFRPGRGGNSTVYPVSFSLNDDYKLNSLTVVPLEDGTLTPEPTPVWQLISESNSAPTRAFRYGEHIPGMKPALQGVHADPLVPDVVYRITLTSGTLTASQDFKTEAASP